MQRAFLAFDRASVQQSERQTHYHHHARGKMMAIDKRSERHGLKRFAQPVYFAFSDKKLNDAEDSEQKTENDNCDRDGLKSFLIVDKRERGAKKY